MYFQSLHQQNSSTSMDTVAEDGAESLVSRKLLLADRLLDCNPAFDVLNGFCIQSLRAVYLF